MGLQEGGASLFAQIRLRLNIYQWDSYPKLPPMESYPPVKLGQGFYYVNSFEPCVTLFPIFALPWLSSLRFISTMETETLSSRNIVDLLLDDLFNASICGPQITDLTNITTSDKNDYVYGWDC